MSDQSKTEMLLELSKALIDGLVLLGVEDKIDRELLDTLRRTAQLLYSELQC